MFGWLAMSDPVPPGVNFDFRTPGSRVAVGPGGADHPMMAWMVPGGGLRCPSCMR